MRKYRVQAVVGDGVALSDSIKVRLREGQALVYAAQAEQRGIGIAAFIRDRLDQIDRIGEELAGIRAAMIDMGDVVDELREQRANAGHTAVAQVHNEPPLPNAVQIETLMLLRAIVPLNKKRMIDAELDRQGIESWRGPVR